MPCVLAGDIGGTQTRLALCEDPLRPLIHRTVQSRAHAGLDEIAAAFLNEARSAGHPAPSAAAFGVAGPVLAGSARVTNLPWVLDERVLSKSLGIPRVRLLNDLEATGWGLGLLDETRDLVTILPGAPGAEGNRAILAAGTGLGEAGLIREGDGHRPFATEGGHAGFAPGSEREIEILKFLSREFGPVSWERVLSGPGLHNIFRALVAVSGGVEPEWIRTPEARTDPARAITDAALAGASAVASEAIDLFVTFYGAEAGNVALKFLATGGVYLAGGIAPRIRGRLRGPLFVRGFLEKGPMRPLLEAIPVRIVLREETALLGAARAALAG